jgi:hypothetical protein
MLHPITDPIPAGALFAAIEIEGLSRYRMDRLASEDLRAADKRVAEVLRAMPTHWAGDAGDCFILVHPRPDRSYRFVWTAGP